MTDGADTEEVRRAREQIRSLQAEIAKASGKELTREQLAELEKLNREKIQSLKNRVRIRTLEIDEKDGKLYYRGARNERVEVRTDVDAAELVKREQELAGSKSEVFFVIVSANPNFRM